MTIFDKIRLFLWSKVIVYIIVILITIISLSLLVYLSCIPQKLPPINDVVMYELDKSKAVVFPMELYVPENEFKENEITILEKATNDWYAATKGVVNIKLIKNAKMPMFFSMDNYKDYPKKTIWKRNANSEEAVKHFLKYSITASGFTIDNYILIIEDGLDDRTLYITFKHEIGHLVKLQHLNSNYEGLMLVTGNEGIITRWDLFQIDYLYNTSLAK